MHQLRHRPPRTGVTVPNDTPLATPRGFYSPVREVEGLVYVSGTSARRRDNTIAGATRVDEMGTFRLDIVEQTTAVLENMEKALGSVGLDRSDIVDATSFLVSMNDFAGYNQAWADFFASVDPAPARTTVAVHQLPHPHLLVEIKAVAAKRQPKDPA